MIELLRECRVIVDRHHEMLARWLRNGAGIDAEFDRVCGLLKRLDTALAGKDATPTRPHDAQTQTPRTDYAASLIKFAVVGEQYEVVSADFSRQLERELQAERERGRRAGEEMTEERARKILGDTVQANGELYCLGHYTAWRLGDERATLDCEFSAEELAAIAWWMRNAEAPSRAESAPEGGKDG